MGERRKASRLAAVLIAAALALAVPLGASAAECEGDDCQGPPPAPAEVSPGTASVEGPPNPPVHFPKHHRPKKHPKKKPHHRGHPNHRGVG